MSHCMRGLPSVPLALNGVAPRPPHTHSLIYFPASSPIPAYGSEDNFSSLLNRLRPLLTCAKLHVHKVIEDNREAPGQERMNDTLPL